MMTLPLFGQSDLDKAIEVCRANAPADGSPYYGLFSGGKDSVALREVARMAGVPVVWHYNVTTIDPPELVHFIRREYPDVIWVRSPHGNFFRRAETKGFPTRRCRWCCEEYKERRNPPGATMLMGIRAQESARRAARWTHAQPHWRTGDTVINPLLWWGAEDLWLFIRGHSVPYCELYDEGFYRLGCIGCPMARGSGRRRQFARWPRFETLWQRLFWRVWGRRTGTLQRDGRPWFGDAYFADWRAMWEWWLSDRPLPALDTGQLELTEEFKGR
jgi:phosphoadenosine phosphosulfate reductase